MIYKKLSLLRMKPSVQMKICKTYVECFLRNIFSLGRKSRHTIQRYFDIQINSFSILFRGKGEIKKEENNADIAFF